MDTNGAVSPTKRPIIYIAAPFGAPTEAEREYNTQRAELLCLLAQRTGYAPICVHSGVLRGTYGDDDDPQDRFWGLETCKRLLDVCDQLWVLLRDDNTMSDGVKTEFRAFRATNPDRFGVAGTWKDWREDMKGYNLLDRWAALGSKKLRGSS